MGSPVLYSLGCMHSQEQSSSPTHKRSYKKKKSHNNSHAVHLIYTNLLISHDNPSQLGISLGEPQVLSGLQHHIL